MEIGSIISWIAGIPILALIAAAVLWWLLGKGVKGVCTQCGAPKIFGEKCLSCGNVSVNNPEN